MVWKAKRLFAFLLAFAVVFGLAFEGGGECAFAATKTASKTTTKTTKTTAKKTTTKTTKTTTKSATKKKKKKKTYTISPNSKPCSEWLLKQPGYNKKTKHYFLLRSYMDRLEWDGGGTLVLKKGTYYLNTAVNIPSNVTLKLNNGVVLKKTFKDTGEISRSYTMFRLCPQSFFDKSTKYEGKKLGKFKKGYKKYDGVKNVKIIGSGNATIDLGNVESAYGIVMGHNKDVQISGITFTNCKGGHFIEMDAAKNVVIKDCKFKNQTDPDGTDECINIDTPDLLTGGFIQPWSSFDKTPNLNVTIKDCKFTNICRAVGTHQYSYGHPHKNIVIKNCTITNTKSHAIQAMNWWGATVKGCKISHVGKGKDDGAMSAIFCPGTRKITIKGNVFKDVFRVAKFYPYASKGQKKITPVESGSYFQGNTYSKIGEDFISFVTGWNEKKQKRIDEELVKFELR